MFDFAMMFVQKFRRVKTLKSNKIKQMNGQKKNKKSAEDFIFF